MSWLSCGKILRSNVGTPMVQSLRHRTRRPNIGRPAVPHWRRAVMLELVKPVYEDPFKDAPAAVTCQLKEKAKKEKQVNPFEQILAREFLEKVEQAKMIAVFHRCSMTQAELYAIRLQLAKIGMYYQHYNNNIARLAFTGTSYEPLLQLYQSQTTTFISDEMPVAKLLKMQKKFATLTLLAAVVEDRLMSISDLQRYAALPSLPVLHSQLVGILNTPLQRLSQNLSHHQMELSSNLSRYISDQTSENPKETVPDKGGDTS